MPANQFKRFLADQSGATMIEYGLLLAILSLGLVTAFTLLGNSLGNLFAGGAGSAANKIGAAAATIH